jgi:hypothetical protein
VPAVEVFRDDFESGDFSHRQNGVHWGVESVDVTVNISHSGTKSARFLEGDHRPWSELRFAGLANPTEVYLQYYLYLPSGSESPSVGPKAKIIGPGNDKFFRLWGGSYSERSYTNQVGASTWGDGSGVDGTLGGEYLRSLPGEGNQMNLDQIRDGTQKVPFFKDANRGRWLQIRIRVKEATSANNDGVLQIWVDGSLVINWTDLDNGDIYSTGPNVHGFTEGYILGWANNSWPVGQVVYLDDFVITTGGFGPP